MVILFPIVSALWLLNISTLFVLSAVLGLLGPVIIFLAYDTVLIGGSGSATVGMLLMGLKAVNAEGGKDEYPQAFIVTALIYIIRRWDWSCSSHSSVNAAVVCKI